MSKPATTTETIAQTANEVLRNLIDAAASTGDFLKEQIPDVIQQLLTYNLVYSLVMLGVWAFLLTVGNYALYRLEKWMVNTGNEELLLIPLVVGTINTFVSITNFTSNANIALKIWLAPKIYLLEYASNLVK